MQRSHYFLSTILMVFLSFLFFNDVGCYAAAKEKPNNPPVAQFQVEKQYVVQGERINYINQSYDPDGDKIVEEKWTGRLPFFFQSGVHKVTLQVKDSRGLWSNPVEVNITVWRQVKVDAFSRLVGYSKVGNIIDLTDEEPLSFSSIDPIIKEWGPTLLLSDSPETIKQNGILYADKARGNIRLFYYHLNGTNEKKKVYILAENLGEDTAKIDIYRQGQAGPSSNELLLGKNGLASYFSAQGQKTLTIGPKETIILNPEGSKKSAAPGQTIHEIMDIFSDSLVRFSFVVVGEKDDVLEKYKGDMLILPRDKHPRGTFLNANRYFQIPVNDNRKQRVSLADNKKDMFLIGKDNLTGETSINYGNYGVLYNISMASKYKTGLVTVVRGGAFSGAVMGPDGQLHFIPGKGVMRAFTQGAITAFYNPSEDYKENMLLMIPVASATPVDLLVAPIENK